MSCANKANKENSSAQALTGPVSLATTPPGLLTLPPEVRLEIYDIYFASRFYDDDSGILQRFQDPTAKTESGLIRSLVDRLEVKSDDFDSRRETSNLNLLSVSKLIHAEALPRFYHQHLICLPTYCCPVPGSGWTGLDFEPPVLRSEQMRHFHLIKTIELVHQHLGDVVADRQHTDRAISSLIDILNARCTSLRHLSINVHCDVKEERTEFRAQKRARRIDYPYLDFRRQTPKALQTLLPRLDRMEIHLLDSDPEHGFQLCGGQTMLLAWSWYWKPIAEEQKAKPISQVSTSHFFYDRSAELSPEEMKRGIDRNILYSLASMEPFAHFIKPGMDRGYMNKYARGDWRSTLS